MNTLKKLLANAIITVEPSPTMVSEYFNQPRGHCMECNAPASEDCQYH